MDCFTVMMDHRVTVYSPTTSRDGGGGTAIVWTTVRESGVACLVNAPMAAEQERFAQENLAGEVTVATFYSGTQRGDQLYVTTGAPYVGARLRVTGIKKQAGVAALGFDDLYHVSCEKVE